MKNLKKLFASVASVAILASMLPVATLGAASYSDELQEAYDYAYGVGITTQSSIDAANMYGTLTRAHMAKMMVNFAEEIFGQEPDTTKECSFTDLAGQTEEMKGFIEESCQLGLMGVGIKAFNPNGAVTRAQFGTVLSRVLRGDENEGGDPYYANHLEALKDAGIMNNISNPMANEIRGYVMLMMMRADSDSETPEICETPENQTACSLGLDTCPEECVDEEPTVELAGSLDVTLSDDTMEATKVPYGAQGLAAATFEIEAGDEDVDLTSASFERVGMGAENAVEDIALFTEDGRVTKAKSFNSDDEAMLTFSPMLTIKAGEKITLKAVVSTTTDSANKGNEFAISLVGLTSTAEDTDADFPLIGNEMEIGSVAATEVVVKNDTSVSDVKVGEDQAEILKFKLENKTTTNEDVKLTSITFKEEGTIDEQDELTNYTLYYDGDEVATAKADSKYITFNLDDAVTIEESKTEKFVVKADIEGGAAKIISLVVDKPLDVMLEASKYGFVKITDSLIADTVNVEAGELTIVSVDPTYTEIRKDKDNVVVGTLKVTSNAGKNLELDDFAVTLIEDVAAATGVLHLSSLFENVELYDSTRGSVYDLACAVSSDDLVCSDSDMDIALKDGTTTFQIRLDTQDENIDGLKFHAEVNVASNVNVYETEDDTEVTDITPALISFKSIEGQASSASVNLLALSATKSAVIGSSVEALKFEIEAGESAAINVNEIVVLGDATDASTAGTDLFDRTRINEVRLYKGSVSEANLLDKVSGSNIASDETVTFNDLDIDIAADSKITFYVVVDVISDVNQDEDSFKVSINSVSAEDEDDEISVSLPGTKYNRTSTIQGYGTLATVVKTSEAPVNVEQNVLGGTTSNFVASYELTAENEGVEINEMQLTNSGTAGLQSAVNEVVLYANDKTTEIARESVTSDTVTFDNLNYTVAEGSQKMYVKVVTYNIGKGKEGTAKTALTLKLAIKDAAGEDSGKDISLPAITSASNEFNVLPVMLSVPAVTSTVEGTTSLIGTKTIARMTLTAQANTNTDKDDGTSLATLARSIAFDVNSSNLSFTGATFTLKDNAGNEKAGTYNAGVLTFTMAAEDTIAEIDGSENFTVTVNGLLIQSTTADASLELILDSADVATAVLFSDDDTATTYPVMFNSDIEFGSLLDLGN